MSNHLKYLLEAKDALNKAESVYPELYHYIEYKEALLNVENLCHIFKQESEAESYEKRSI